MQASNNILINKLESFIKKHYQNQLLKGAIISLSLILIALFVLSFAEFYGRFSTNIRTPLFYIYLTTCIAVLVWYVIRPILGLINLNRKFGINEASIAIGNHFPEVKDKLLNTLQLQEELTSSGNSLLAASIDQKTRQLSPIPFTKAIPYKKNLKYVKYGLLPAFALLFILLVSPGFKQSANRVVSYNKHFEIEAPFQFITDLNQQDFIQNQNVAIPLSLEGDKIPQDAYVHIGEQRYKMKGEGAGTFSFELKNLQKSTDVYFEAAGFTSKLYPIDILLKPSLLGYSATLNYPSYLGLTNEKIKNIGELTVPEGTTITWNFNTRNVDKLFVLPEKYELEQNNGKAVFKKRFRKSQLLVVKTSNNEVKNGDSVYYKVNTIPDAFPQISVVKQKDSLSNKILYFLGDVTDDHGFSKLVFNYTFNKSKDKTKLGKTERVPIALKNGLSQQGFYHYWNLNALSISPEDEISYFFTVWDNDGVNGSKSAKTPTSTYKAPSIEQIKEETEKANEKIKSSLAGAQAQASEMQKEVQGLEKMLTEKKTLDWNDKKKIEDLLEKHKELQNEIQKSIDQNLEKNFKQEEFNQMDEEMLEKQKQLEELLDEVMDEETKKLMEEIQKLLEENKTDKLQKALDKFEFSQKELSKEMDRMLELFKELELEKKLKETIDNLNELAKKQKDLADKTKNKKGDSESLKKDQDEIKKEFDKAKEDLKDLKKKDSELETPLGLKDKKEMQESIDKKMQDGKNDLDKGKNKDASEDMQDAADEMQEMAAQMQQEMEEAYEEQQMEDYNNLRQILENLVQLSFNQEEVIEGFKKNKNYSPKYIELRQFQRKIKDDTRIVEDSLLALSKRNLQIKNFVNTEIARVNDNIDKSLKYLGERYTNNALVHQQYAMTGYNNLALMLSDALKQMQQQMKASKSKGKKSKGKPKGSCDNPGQKNSKKQGKPNMGTVKKMQQDLAKQLKDLQNGSQKGQKTSNKQFAMMAAKQAAIRKQLRDLERQLNKEGKGKSLGDLKRTQDLMDDLEKDLYFKRINPQTFKKLNTIEIKLSEHEKAQKEQEQDNKRTSNEGQEMQRDIPPSIKKYLEEKKKETELLKSVSPELQPYYKKKVKEYFGS